mmetsp:Transcript_5269/g.12307  ORF Transcript_5269/g.12307 Transcript_5269/m.12307 type:complete len:203 (-) Transcript_5269:2105-2713(-)
MMSRRDAAHRTGVRLDSSRSVHGSKICITPSTSLRHIGHFPSIASLHDALPHRHRCPQGVRAIDLISLRQMTHAAPSSESLATNAVSASCRSVRRRRNTGRSRGFAAQQADMTACTASGHSCGRSSRCPCCTIRATSASECALHGNAPMVHISHSVTPNANTSLCCVYRRRAIASGAIHRSGPASPPCGLTVDTLAPYTVSP